MACSQCRQRAEHFFQFVISFVKCLELQVNNVLFRSVCCLYSHCWVGLVNKWADIAINFDNFWQSGHGYDNATKPILGTAYNSWSLFRHYEMPVIILFSLLYGGTWVHAAGERRFSRSMFAYEEMLLYVYFSLSCCLYSIARALW